MSNSENRTWLWPLIETLKSVFREVVAMSFFINILALAVPVFVLQVYDRVVYNAGISTLQGLVLGMGLVLIFDFILRQARARILQTVALRVDVEVGRKVFNKFASLPLQVLENSPSNHWQALFRDADAIRNTLSGASAILVADLPFAILFLVLIFVIASPIAWILLVMLPIFMFVAWKSAGTLSEANAQERGTTVSRDSLIAEMIQGRTTIKALALDRAIKPIWEGKHADNIERAIERGATTDTYSNLGATLSLITSILLTTLGALAIIDQKLTIGALIATNMLSGRIMGPMNQLVGTWRTYAGFMQSVERLGAIFNMPGERQEAEVKLDRPKGEITIENLVFSYAPDLKPVVHNVSLKIRAGGVHALVGRNGSGKTTLLKMLQGLYTPSSGRVLLDGADIAQFTRAELADWMGYVPQESLLFAGTVRDNIAHRQPDASDEEIIRAATAAGVHHFIIDLPDGYSTEIGEAGGRLSGGQRQRIAIARALVGNPSVVLLDEPSSSLDRQAEQELRNTIMQIGKAHTVVMVTHSPMLLAAADDLVALDKGRIALAGPASDILPRLFGQGAPTKPPMPAPAPAQRPAPKPADVKPAPAQPKAPPPTQPKAPPPAQPKAPPPAPGPGTMALSERLKAERQDAERKAAPAPSPPPPAQPKIQPKIQAKPAPVAAPAPKLTPKPANGSGPKKEDAPRPEIPEALVAAASAQRAAGGRAIGTGRPFRAGPGLKGALKLDADSITIKSKD